jgi:Helix-turn-helix domain
MHPQTILADIVLGCKDLTDTQRFLLVILALHGNPCYPSIPRLATMLHRSERQTQRLLRSLERAGYLTIKKGTGRGRASTYTLKVTPKMSPFSEKVTFTGVSEAEKVTPIDVTPTLKRTKDLSPEKTERLLRRLGLTEGSTAWVAALNGKSH